MSDTNLQSPTPPDLRATLDAFKSEVFASLNCHAVGTIVAFDATKQKASVQLSIQRLIGGVAVSCPVLTDCPVYFPAGGGAYFVFPVTMGDTCLVLFNDQDLDKWFTTGNPSTPNSSRMHDLSDGMVLVGLRSLAQPVTDSIPGAVSLWYKGSQVTITSEGTVLLRNGPGDARVDIGSKIDVRNTATSLKASLNQLMDTLDAWVNTGGSTPNPATLLALAATRTTINSLLA